MNIRPATAADLPAIAALQCAGWQDAYASVLPANYLANQLSQDLARHWEQAVIQPSDVVLVAEQDSLIGFIAVWCRPDPFIDNLHVAAPLRSSGTGEALMRSAAGRLLAQGQRTACLWVVEGNQRAVRFYERRGGVIAERARKSLFGHDAWSIKLAWPDIAVLTG